MRARRFSRRLKNLARSSEKMLKRIWNQNQNEKKTRQFLPFLSKNRRKWRRISIVWRAQQNFFNCNCLVGYIYTGFLCFIGSRYFLLYLTQPHKRTAFFNFFLFENKTKRAAGHLKLVGTWKIFNTHTHAHTKAGRCAAKINRIRTLL